ncbi:MAG: hypothetical protein J5535_07445 [Firmicutes bacterium]|nr:hypothetical protein [Bacillota bacterium]
MGLTLLLALALILALCLLLYAAVVLIQDKRFFTTAPKDIQEAAVDHPERFPGAHALGWVLAVISALLMAGAFLYGGFDGIRRGFSFWQFFLRFALMLYIWKAFDIVCLDWLLLTRSHYFQRYYPETEGCAGYHQFGFNRKEQITRIILFPFVAALMAGIAL